MLSIGLGSFTGGAAPGTASVLVSCPVGPWVLVLRKPLDVALESPLLMLKMQQVFLPTYLQATPQHSLHLLCGSPWHLM